MVQDVSPSTMELIIITTAVVFVGLSGKYANYTAMSLIMLLPSYGRHGEKLFFTVRLSSIQPLFSALYVYEWSSERGVDNVRVPISICDRL
jgi:hypothetical protein